MDINEQNNNINKACEWIDNHSNELIDFCYEEEYYENYNY